VLVARSASVNNSMQVSFNANNVDAKIVASGMNYANSTATGSDGEVIAITGNTGDSATVVFKATMDEATDGVGFGEARLYSAGRAVYTFAVTNTANVSNTRVLKVLATVTKVNDAGENEALSDDDNMTILIGSSEATATAVSADSNLYYVEIGPGQASGNIVVVAKVTDPHQDVNNFLLGLQLDFGYDIEDPNVKAALTVNIEYKTPENTDITYYLNSCELYLGARYLDSTILNNEQYTSIGASSTVLYDGYNYDKVYLSPENTSVTLQYTSSPDINSNSWLELYCSNLEGMPHCYEIIIYDELNNVISTEGDVSTVLYESTLIGISTDNQYYFSEISPRRIDIIIYSTFFM